MEDHRVQPGDTLTSIAKHFGFGDWRKIWDDPANEELRKLRVKPHFIEPGDILKIPDRAVKDEAKPAGEEHKFKVKVQHPAKLRFIDDGGVPHTAAAVEKTRLSVSNRITTADLPAAFATASTDRDNFKVEVEDEGVKVDKIPAAKVVIKVLRPGLTHTLVAGDTLSSVATKYNATDWHAIYDHPKNAGFKAAHPNPNVIAAGPKIWVPTPRRPTRFNPERTLQVELERVPGTKLFRSRYLRLVVDDQDKAASPTQTVLTDEDPNDDNVDILGQIVRVKYTSSSGEVIAKSATVGAAGSSFLRVGVHIVRTAAGAAGVVGVPRARAHILTWFRRSFAQIDIAPLLLFVNQVDPTENLISVSNDSGANATGGPASFMQFMIMSARPGGGAPAAQFVGPHRPGPGATPMGTAGALAALINGGGTFTARTVQNPPVLDAAILQGSADLLITDPGGGRVTIVGLVSTDATQTLTVGRVNTANFVGWAAGATSDWVVGSIQQRALLQAYDTGADRMEIIVIGTFTTGPRGQAMIPGSFYAAGRQANAQCTRSAFVTAATVATDDPYNAPHESGHSLIDAIHAQQANQLMMGAGTTPNHNVNASKRIYETAVNFDDPPIGIVQETRLRANGGAVLTAFS